jgi:transposase InsO family protein
MKRRRRFSVELKRRWIRTIDSNHRHRIYSNLVRNLAVTAPNQVWVADITYIGIQNGFQISMARKGNPYDNAAAESFIKTLKTEEVYLWEYRTLADVQIRLPFFIKEVYNRKRLHSSFGYRPPVEFEEMFIKTKNPCPAALTSVV